MVRRLNKRVINKSCVRFENCDNSLGIPSNKMQKELTMTALLRVISPVVISVVDNTGMSEAEGVKAAVEAVKALSASINIPQKLHEINVKEEDIPALAVAAFNDVCTGGNPRPTSVADIEALYRKAF